jgi:hypothetical protein
MRVIRVEVSGDGVRILYQEGFEGEECFEEAGRLYALLRQYGVFVNVLQSQPTDEYYAASNKSKGVVRDV